MGWHDGILTEQHPEDHNYPRLPRNHVPKKPIREVNFGQFLSHNCGDSKTMFWGLFSVLEATFRSSFADLFRAILPQRERASWVEPIVTDYA